MVVEKILPKYVGPAASPFSGKMTQDQIRERFDAETAAAYSQRKPVWLPEYASSMRLVTKVLRSRLALAKAARVLDLGAGTGNLSRRVLEAFPSCQVTLVDFSENMLSEVPKVLAAHRDHYFIYPGDFWEVDFPAGSFEAVVSSFALHHGRGESVYQGLYKKIHTWLRPDGIFVCCDVVQGDTPEVEAMNLAGWRGYLSRKISPSDARRVLSNYGREDSPISLRNHLWFLEEAGFRHVDVLWKRFNFAIYMAEKE